MKKFPKKAKLISETGFSKIIKTNGMADFRISFPIQYQIQLNDPTFYGINLTVSYEAIFQLEKTTKTMAIYKQSSLNLQSIK